MGDVFDPKRYADRLFPAYEAVDSLPGDLPALGERMLTVAMKNSASIEEWNSLTAPN